MDQSPQKQGLSSFLQALLGGTMIAIVFSLGIFVGKNTNDTTIRLAIPEPIQFKGLPHDRLECLKWVSENMKDPTAGTFSLICHGRLP